MFKFLIKFLFLSLIFFTNYSFSKTINIQGFFKLNLNDIQSLTGIDIFSSDFDENKVNNLINELYLSDLIQDVSYKLNGDVYVISIVENKIINEIFINGNVRIDDASILDSIQTNKNQFFNKSTILNDLDLIRKIYRSRGYSNSNVSLITESYSQDKINLILQIEEGDKNELKSIKFIGNEFISSKVLSSTINSKAKGFNIFSTSSNLNEEIFDFDKNKIINFYNDKGFNEVEVSYLVEKSNFKNFNLIFYIKENHRSKIIDVNYNLDSNLLELEKINEEIRLFEKQLTKNRYFYDYEIFNNFINGINRVLKDLNIFNQQIIISIDQSDKDFIVSFDQKSFDPTPINKINIYGNSITKESTIRSKFTILPGDFYDEYKINNDLKRLKKLPYISDVTKNISNNNNSLDINVDVIENKKTGKFLVAGTATGDTGLGFALGLSDDNVFGSGNRINTSFNINSEDASFDVLFTQYLINNPNLSNKYRIYNSESDLVSSFGYKKRSVGASYSLNYQVNEFTNSNIGLVIENIDVHSPSSTTDLSITDSLGQSVSYQFIYNISKNTTNDIFYPNTGAINSLDLIYSPEFSNNSYVKALLRNSMYFKHSNSKNFTFIDNRFGYTDSLTKNKLETINSFSLGGISFKGFDYRGIGKKSSSGIYLGGKNYFTSTLGYGGTFIFDKSDTVNFKLFSTIGSLWGNDYIDSPFELRTSAGLSLDFATPIGPISFSYAQPISKTSNDRTKSFNFTIGTSF